MLKVRVKFVDKHGFTGRDFHPKESDIGVVATVLAMRTGGLEVAYEVSSNDFDRLDASVLAQVASQPKDESYQVLQCVTEDGRKLELMTFEVEYLNEGGSK
jgi:hypothetical protein